MKPTHKHPEDLLRTARQLPLPMSLAQVHLLVRDFPAGGPAPPDPFPLPKAFTMVGVIGTAGLLLTQLFTPTVAVRAELAPRSPEAPTGQLLAAAEEDKHPAVELKAAESSQIETAAVPKATPLLPANVLPELRSSAPAMAPAPAPTSPAGLPFGKTLLTGTYGLSDDGTELTLRLDDEATLTLDLDAQEQKHLFPEPGRNGYLERETGRLVLAAEGGKFHFQARTAFRDRYEAKGWGTSDLPQKSGDRTADERWLAYFDARVGEDYLAGLEDLGLRREHLSDLWRLVDAGIGLPRLWQLKKSLPAGGNEARSLTVTDLIDHHRNLPKDGGDNLLSNTLLFGDDGGDGFDLSFSFGDDRDPTGHGGWSTRSDSLPAFDKLIVMDGLRVIVAHGDSNHVTVRATDDSFWDIKTKVNRRGELMVYSAIPFISKSLELDEAEIHITTTGLKKAHARNRAKILVDPATGVAKWSVYGKGEVIVSKETPEDW